MTHRDHIRRARSNRTKYTIDEQFFAIMGKKEALFLQKLIDLDDRPGTPHDKDFFLCTGEYLEASHWPLREQNRHLERLATRGFIKVQRRKWQSGNQRPCRWVLVNYEGIEAALDGVSGNTAMHNDKTNSSYRDTTTCPTKYSSTKNTEEERTQSTVARRSASPPRRDDGDGVADLPSSPIMFPPSPKECSPPVSQEHVDMAVTLRDGLARRVTLKRLSLKNWASVFARLCGRYTPAYVRKVLDWYVKNVRKDYVPLAFCARSFDAKFERIEAAMSRHGRDHPPPVEVSNDAERVIKKLSRVPFPKGADAQLPAAVQQSLDNAAPLKAAVRAVEERLKDAYGNRDGRVLKLARVLRLHFRSLPDFVFDWFERVRDRVDCWDRWSGELKPFVFHPDHEMFLRWVRGVAAEATGRPETWDELASEAEGVS